MMVETILESSQDFGMSNGSLPQWKRELLQRRLARSRPCAAPAPPPPPPPPPPAAEDDEELRYGPGIVKRLKSRYLSLALRDAPRRRPSVLRRAASLEHLLDERPPPAPRPRAPRPASLAAPPPLSPHCAPPRRESVKRARSVDALSRLDSREDPAPPSPSPRAPRPPRRPQPLLRETERPPPDVVRSTLRKFESAPTRRAAPAARVSAVLKGLEPRRSVTPEGPETPRSPSPRPTREEPSPPPSPPPPASPPPPIPSSPPPPIFTAPTLDPPPPASPPPTARSPILPRSPVPTFAPIPTFVPVPTLAPAPTLDSVKIANVPKIAPIPTLAPVPTLAPAPTLDPVKIASVPKIAPVPTLDPVKIANDPKLASAPGATTTPRIVQVARTARSPTEPAPIESPSTDEVEGCAASNPGQQRRVSRAALEEIARAGSSVRYAFASPLAASHLPPLAATNPVMARGPRRVGVIRPMPSARVAPEKVESPRSPPERTALVNGHSTPEPSSLSRIGAAGIERAWSGSAVKMIDPPPSPLRETPDSKPSWLRTAGARPRAPPAAATSVVFNFSNRKEVPDYVENDGIILRASRRNRIKAGEPGVVVLRPEALTVETDSDAEDPDAEVGPPSPCDVRFVNDNVLINGKSSLLGKPNKDRISKLKLQFDDSLTRTFEYPSELSMSEDFPCPATAAVPATPVATGNSTATGNPTNTGTPTVTGVPTATDNSATLSDNTHIASAALSRYTPSKTCAASFQLGLINPHPIDQMPPAVKGSCADHPASPASEEGDARPCGADAAKSWSDARAQHTDLLF